MKKYFYLMLLVFTAVTGFYFFWSWAQLPPNHRYIYPLDDVYIHLALARNFAEFAVWSINTSGFDSASSSILYTLLLSGLIKVFGDWEYYPLIINILFGYLTVYAVYRYFKDFYSAAELKWALFLMFPFTLLYVMVLIGMEHTIHMFLMVLAVYFIHKNVESNFSRNDFLVLMVLTFFLSIVRFESMFFAVSLAFALFLRKDFGKGVAVLLSGFLAIVVFGLISMQNGGFFFPNSVMIKGSYPEQNHILLGFWQRFRDGVLLNTSFYKCLFFPLLIILMYIIKKYRKVPLRNFFRNETLIIVVVIVGILHSLFAILKYRYENYVMIATLLIIVPIVSNVFKKIKIKNLQISDYTIIASTVAVVLVSVYRFGYHHLPLKYSSKGINEQQVEMARFLADYYKGEKVLANDIGAISYFSHVQLIDMVGLGSTDIARFKMDNKQLPRTEFNEQYRKFIIKYTAEQDCKVAVIYPEWFPGKPPSNWIPVASWRSRNAYGPAIERIVFYATAPEAVAPLQKKLLKFDLNKNVEQWFYIHAKR